MSGRGRAGARRALAAAGTFVVAEPFPAAAGTALRQDAAAGGAAGQGQRGPLPERGHSAARAQVNKSSFGPRAGRGRRGLPGSPAPPGRAAGPGFPQPSPRCPSLRGRGRGPGRGRVCIYGTNTPVIMCSPRRTCSPLHKKAPCSRFPHPVTVSAGIWVPLQSDSSVCRHRALTSLCSNSPQCDIMPWSSYLAVELLLLRSRHPETASRVIPSGIK